MTRLRFVLLASLLTLLGQPALAQHCAPVVESYLSEVSLKRVDGQLELRAEYTLDGGRGQDAFQAYVLAYLERDAARVPAPALADSIGPEAALVLHTQVIERSDDGAFDLAFEIDEGELAKLMIAHGKLGEDDRVETGGWGAYRDRVRLAVFVPWLDDEQHSVLEGLPEDRHCCNYSHAPELLFQSLPYRLRISYGIVKAHRLEDGAFAIEIHGDRAPTSNWPPAKEQPADAPPTDAPPADQPPAPGPKARRDA
ncbi:MAG: hypothetical protein P1V81_05810 [Planctomycetota bacterium]|nr:hypothetical protein [Planctomycetota bacterium]